MLATCINNNNNNTDFASCGTKWLDKDDSCHRSIQIASQRAKCRREEAHAMLLRTPSDARSRKTVASAFERTCHQAESVQVELQKYEDEGVVSDLRYVRSRSVLVEEIESLDRLIHWLEIDLKPDQKWEVPQDRVRAQGLYFLSVREKCVI